MPEGHRGAIREVKAAASCAHSKRWRAGLRRGVRLREAHGVRPACRRFGGRGAESGVTVAGVTSQGSPIPWFVPEFGLGPSVCKNHPQAAPCGIEPHVRKRFRPFGAAQRAFPTRSPQRLPGFSGDSQAAVISPPSFPAPPLPFPSFPLVSEKSNGTISPSPARAILPPMRDSFAPPPSSSPRPLAGSPAQAPTEPARAAPTPANPPHLLDANQAKPRKTKENQTRGPRWPSDLPCPLPP